MPKGKKSLIKERQSSPEEQEEQEVMGGHPAEGGNPMGNSRPQGDQGDPGDEDDTPEPQAPVDPAIALATLQGKFDAQQREIDHLRRTASPITVKEPAAPKPTPKTDWEKLLFEDPEKAVQLIKEQTREEVSLQLRAEYQRERNTQLFWDQFYELNKDLKQDHDMVQGLLNANFNELSNIPIADAYEKLADLTRTRILRYAGMKPNKGGKKVQVEGAEPPSPPKPVVEEDKVVTLSDIIRSRAAKRRSSAA